MVIRKILLLSFRVSFQLPTGHYSLATLGQVQFILSQITLNSPPSALRQTFVTDWDFRPSASGLQGGLALKLLPKEHVQAHSPCAQLPAKFAKSYSEAWVQTMPPFCQHPPALDCALPESRHQDLHCYTVPPHTALQLVPGNCPTHIDGMKEGMEGGGRTHKG